MNTIINNSISLYNPNDQLFLKTLTSIWALFNVALTTIISLFVIIYVVIIYISKKKSKKSFRVSLILIFNTCLTIVGSCITLGFMILSSIGGDHNIVSLKRIIFFGCYFRGYLLIVFVLSIYLSYILQASYRLFRIVYHKYKYLRTMSAFSYYILVQWILSLVLILPMRLSNTNFSPFIIYLSEDFNCEVSLTNAHGITVLMITVYLLPLCCLILIYFWIIFHIRSKKTQPTITLKLRCQNKHDASIIKQICTVMVVLCILGTPPSLFFITYVITGYLHWSVYRICSISMSLSVLFISFSSLYVTPQIYKKIRIIFGCPKHHKKHHIVSYEINIKIERERKIESLLLENSSFTDPNILI